MLNVASAPAAREPDKLGVRAPQVVEAVPETMSEPLSVTAELP